MFTHTAALSELIPNYHENVLQPNQQHHGPNISWEMPAYAHTQAHNMEQSYIPTSAISLMLISEIVGVRAYRLGWVGVDGVLLLFFFFVC